MGRNCRQFKVSVKFTNQNFNCKIHLAVCEFDHLPSSGWTARMQKYSEKKRTVQLWNGKGVTIRHNIKGLKYHIFKVNINNRNHRVITARRRLFKLELLAQ